MQAETILPMFFLFLLQIVGQDSITSSRMKIHESNTLVKHSKKKNFKQMKNDESFESTSLKDVKIPAVKKTKRSHGVDKNVILRDYQQECSDKGISCIVSTTTKGETVPTPPSYPPRHLLVKNCTMKPSSSHYYRVGNLHFVLLKTRAC